MQGREDKPSRELTMSCRLYRRSIVVFPFPAQRPGEVRARRIKLLAKVG
jgi:hypothetical protein